VAQATADSITLGCPILARSLAGGPHLRRVSTTVAHDVGRQENGGAPRVFREVGFPTTGATVVPAPYDVYDLVGKIQQVSDPTGTYAFAYDNMGRLIGTSTQYTFLPGHNFQNSVSDI
jgi:YD repeat-containing protein